MNSSREYPADDRRSSKFPRKMGSIINQLMARRGYAQVFANEQLREVIVQTIGSELAATVRIGNLKRGVLELYASDSVTLQELTFKKRKILRDIDKAMPTAGVKDLRFRISA